MEKKLYRDEYRKKLGGVCAGLSDYFNVDVAIVRLIFVLACILHGGGLMVYIVLWIVLPKKPFSYANPTVDYTVPGGAGTQDANAPGQTPFGSNPFPNQPFTNQPFEPRKSNNSTAAIIIGTILIIVGGSILLTNLDIWPDWEYWKLWPVIPISVGLILMISGDDKKKLKDEMKWQQAQEVKPEEVKPEGENQDEASHPDNEPKA